MIVVNVGGALAPGPPDREGTAAHQPASEASRIVIAAGMLDSWLVQQVTGAAPYRQ